MPSFIQIVDMKTTFFTVKMIAFGCMFFIACASAKAQKPSFEKPSFQLKKTLPQNLVLHNSPAPPPVARTTKPTITNSGIDKMPVYNGGVQLPPVNSRVDSLYKEVAKSAQHGMVWHPVIKD